MRTVYSSTCPAWHDTLAISKAKWAQVTAGGVASHRSDRSVLYSQLYPTTNDTKNMVLGKILQGNCDDVSSEIEVVAVTNFDGSETTLTWSTPAGSYGAEAGYVIYRNEVAIAYPAFGVTSYADDTIESGETYIYSVRFHPS